MNPGSKCARIVLDTNVLFSALAFARDNPPLKILNLVRDGKIEAVLSPFILEELRSNLIRKAGWEESRFLAVEKISRQHFYLIKPRIRLSVIQRVDADNRILECALDAEADALVTGNRKDLRPLGTFQGIAILTPREFLDQYFPSPHS